MAEETIFSKIIRREIPADVVYQDELVTAFRDISPQAPTHVLIVPNVLIPTVNDVTVEHEAALGRMITAAAKIAEQEGIAEDGYRLIVNCNRHAGQEVYHIHMHRRWPLAGAAVVTLSEEIMRGKNSAWSGGVGVGVARRVADGVQLAVRHRGQ